MAIDCWTIIGGGTFGVRGNLTPGDVEKLIKTKTADRLHIEKPLSTKGWKLIQDKLISKRPDITIRCFGSGSTWDGFSFLRQIPSVQRLQIDHVTQLQDIEAIAELPDLRRLEFGCYNLKDFDFFARLPEQLEELIIGQTASKKLNLNILSRYKQLKVLYLEGHSKGIETIKELGRLEELTLRSIKADGLAFLTGLKHLWMLDIKLGGTTDLSALKKMKGITYLELWMIKGLRDLSFIPSMTGLRYLFLQSLTQIESLPDLSKLKKLRRVDLESMKDLKSIEGVAKAPALEAFIHTDARGMKPEAYLPMLKHNTLETFRAFTGRVGDNKQIVELMAEYGLSKETDEPDAFDAMIACKPS
ncbi:MAG: leucine-rich repeat domain-containing protein [Planctomycetota bacterium]